LPHEFWTSIRRRKWLRAIIPGLVLAACGVVLFLVIKLLWTFGLIGQIIAVVGLVLLALLLWGVHALFGLMEGRSRKTPSAGGDNP
jgi:hypothetical protein